MPRITRFDDRVFFPNSDLSGIAIFEEAQYYGVEVPARRNGLPTDHAPVSGNFPVTLCLTGD